MRRKSRRLIDDIGWNAWYCEADWRESMGILVFVALFGHLPRDVE